MRGENTERWKHWTEVKTLTTFFSSKIFLATYFHTYTDHITNIIYIYRFRRTNSLVFSIRIYFGRLIYQWFSNLAVNLREFAERRHYPDQIFNFQNHYFSCKINHANTYIWPPRYSYWTFYLSGHCFRLEILRLKFLKWKMGVIKLKQTRFFWHLCSESWNSIIFIPNDSPYICLKLLD